MEGSNNEMFYRKKGNKEKREESNGIKNMIALAWIEWPDSDYRRPLMT